MPMENVAVPRPVVADMLLICPVPPVSAPEPAVPASLISALPLTMLPSR